MPSKLITVSLPEALIWKLGRLNQQTGVSKSRLVAQALLLVIAEYASFVVPGGIQIGSDVTLDEIEAEYEKEEIKDGKAA